MKEKDLGHVYLYAKDWYKKTDIISDLKILIGLRSGLKTEDVRVEDIIIVLTDEIKHYLKEDGNLLLNIINDIHPANVWRLGYVPADGKSMNVLQPVPPEKYDLYRAVLYKYLEIFRFQKISDILAIEPDSFFPEPNPQILPIYDTRFEI